MAGPDTAAAFDRRQDEAWRHLEARRTIPATAACRRGNCRDASYQGQAHTYGGLDQEAPGEKPFRLVSVAIANKLDRIAWVVLTRKETYHPYAHLT